MNFAHSYNEKNLRNAIFDGNVAKCKSALSPLVGKVDLEARTEGGFTMLHCASLLGNTQIVMLLLQYKANIHSLTPDGYTALDLALWKGFLQITELMRTQGCVAPMKEPESLNGKIIRYLGKEATVCGFEPSTSIKTSSLRALYFANGECKYVNVWAGTDYEIIGHNPNYESLRNNEFSYESEEPEEFQQSLAQLVQGQGYFDNDSDSDDDSEVDEVVEVPVPPGPLGLLLDSGTQDCAVIQGFTNLPNGEKGTIERSGKVHKGMYIIGINDVNASLMTLQQVTQQLGKLSRKEKTMRFAVYRPSSPGGSTRSSVVSAPSMAQEPPPFPPSRRSIQSHDSESTCSATSLPPPLLNQENTRPRMKGLQDVANEALQMRQNGAGMNPEQSTREMRSTSLQQETDRANLTSSSRAGRSTSLSQWESNPTSSRKNVADILSSECMYCGMPSTVHSSANCPYR